MYIYIYLLGKMVCKVNLVEVYNYAKESNSFYLFIFSCEKKTQRVGWSAALILTLDLNIGEESTSSFTFLEILEGQAFPLNHWLGPFPFLRLLEPFKSEKMSRENCNKYIIKLNSTPWIVSHSAITLVKSSTKCRPKRVYKIVKRCLKSKP